ncbi:MAG: hypothetical protein ABI867_30865 [Kofleriaceae bacterium]
MKTIIAALILASVAIAHADDEIVRGNVVKVEASEIYVNLGTNREVADGAALRIKRPVRLQHPITRAAIEDWVPVGSAVVTQAGSQLSRAVVGVLIDDVRIGDVAEVLVDRPDRAHPTPQPPPPPPAPPSAAPAIDPATADVLASFTAQSGQSLDARIAAWEKYLSTHPASPYAAAIRIDLESLGALREQMRPASPNGEAETGSKIEHAGPPSAHAGAPVPLVFVLDQPERVASAYLHYRTAHDRTYRRVLLVREHDIYLRGAVPATAVKAPGVEYFLEVASPSGNGSLALASPAQPLSIAVAKPSPILERFAPAPNRSSVKIAGEVLDFATFDKRTGDHHDRLTTANVDFTYRLDRVVESIGVGYGVFVGQGGFADRTYTEGDEAPRSAFQFGYADTELEVNDDGVHVSLGGKLIAGVGRDGFGMGGEGRLRIGHRDAANLMFVASAIQQVGALADIRFCTRPASDLKLVVSVGATDQPNNGDIGVKLGSEIEYFASPNVSLLLRASWQGRNTDHGGIGGGGGMGFTW